MYLTNSRLQGSEDVGLIGGGGHQCVGAWSTILGVNAQRREKNGAVADDMLWKTTGGGLCHHREDGSELKVKLHQS